MAQLIATNQLTLTNVSDGQTPYIHWAYSDNADGTGLTLTDNGQRYIGQYSDYTQADSTDKTKYRWADRWAKIEVGGVNLIKNSRIVGIYSNNPDVFPTSNEIMSEGSRTFVRVRRSNTTLNPSLISIFSTIGNLSDNAKNYDKGIVSFKARSSHPVAMSTMIHKVNTSGGMTYGEQRNIDITTNWQTFSFEIPLGSDLSYIRANPLGTITDISSFVDSFYLDLCEWKLDGGNVVTPWQRAPEDIEEEIASKADQDKVVYKTDISVTDEGIIHSASKTVNGQTIASMIAQRAEWVEIIARLLKVKGDMIVDGTIGANKLSVSTLSALTADLGKISGGSLELLKSVAQGTSLDSWGSFTIPAHKWGLYIDNIGAISSGTPVRKSSSESTASDMPVAVLTSGQLRFARVNQNNDLGSVLHYGLSDPDNATISFAVASDGTKQLLIQANGQIVNQGTNYTGWNSTGVAGVYYKRQGDVVALKMQVTTTANQTLNLGKIPASLVPIQNSGTMMRVTAWTADQTFGRNLQIDPDGSMALLASNRGDTINAQVTWII